MNNRTIFSNLFWRYAERFGAQLISFVVTTLLARILDPETYGVVAIVNILINILQVFVDNGLGNALIQKKNADNLDFSTVFFTNVVFCLFLYGLLFFTAPYFAKFYNNLNLTIYIRVLGITILISGIKNVQQAYVSRNMLFKKFFWSTLGGTVVAGIIGIIMALNGLGVWALIAQQLINLTIDTLILWFTVKWRPEFIYSFERLKGLFSYGWKLLVSSLLETIYSNLRQLIIGKKYSSEDLAYYNQGNKYPNIIIINLYMSINSVLLPAMANEQDDINRVKQITKKCIRVSTCIISPLMIGLTFLATPIVRLLLTEKWLPCVFFLQVFCLSYILYPIQSTNLISVKALGRSDLYLKLGIVKNILDVIVLISAMLISVKAMAVSVLIMNVIELFIDGWPNRMLLKYSYFEQFRDYITPIILSLIMGLCILPFQLLIHNDIITIIVSVIVGALVYISELKIIKLDSFEYILDLIKSYKKN